MPSSGPELLPPERDAEHAAAAPSAAAAGARARGVVLVVVLGARLARLRGLLLGLRLRALGLEFGGLELGGDQRVVLGAQVDLLGVVGGGRALAGVLVADQIVLALELLDVAHADLELVGDPGVGAALAHPGADLVEVRAQGFTRHGRSGRLAQSCASGELAARRVAGPRPVGSLSPGPQTMLGEPARWGSRRVEPANRKVHRMLVLTRKSNQSIMIGDDIEVSVLSVMGEKVRIGIQAPQEIPVFRKEIYLEIHREDGRHRGRARSAPTRRAPRSTTRCGDLGEA